MKRRKSPRAQRLALLRAEAARPPQRERSAGRLRRFVASKPFQCNSKRPPRVKMRAFFLAGKAIPNRSRPWGVGLTEGVRTRSRPARAACDSHFSSQFLSGPPRARAFA